MNDSNNAILLIYMLFDFLVKNWKECLLASLYMTGHIVIIIMLTRVFVAFTISKNEKIPFKQAWKRLR